MLRRKAPRSACQFQQWYAVLLMMQRLSEGIMPKSGKGRP